MGFTLWEVLMGSNPFDWFNTYHLDENGDRVYNTHAPWRYKQPKEAQEERESSLTNFDKRKEVEETL